MGDSDVGLDIAPLRPPPGMGDFNTWYAHELILIQISIFTVRKCFDCAYANQWRYHFVNTPDYYYLPESSESWFCAGGASPPRACISNDFTHSEDWSRCVCKKGTYLNPINSSSCLQCPAGHYCTNGTMVQCPDHHLKVETGQTACNVCASPPSRQGVYNECEPNKQLQMCLRSVLGSQSTPLQSKCLECSKCKRLYADETDGQVDCYKSYIKGIY